MDEQITDEVINALQEYFNRANLDDENFNTSLAKNYLKSYQGKFLLMAPAVIIDSLRSAVYAQVRQRPFLRADDDLLDQQLKATGLMLLMKYASLLNTAGSGGVLGLILSLPMMLKQDEDMVTINAYTLGALACSSSSSKIAITSSANVFRDIFEQAYNTGCKIALAYTLFQCGQHEPFKSFAVPRLASSNQHLALKRLLTPGDLHLQMWVVSALIMDVASEGRSFLPEAGWQRKR